MMESQVLFAHDVEEFVGKLKKNSLKYVGNSSWWKEHEAIEKLYMQAVINVTSNNNEFVKDVLIQLDKVNTLIHNLIVAEVWSNYIFPIVKKKLQNNASTLPVYMALYHAVSISGLLETSMFYQEVCESCGDEIVDLVDFISRQINKLIMRDEKDVIKREDDKLGHQHQDIEFTLSIKSTSLIKNLCNNLECLPLSCISRMLNTHDFPYLLATLIEKAPWKRNSSDGRRECFDGSKWVPVASDEYHVITKIEGQIWLTLYQLLLSSETQRKYEFTSHRKTHLLKLRKYLNESLLDQLPHLLELQRFLEYLAVTEAPSYKQELLIEQVPVVYSSIMKEYGNEWDKLATFQFNEYFSPTTQQMQDQAKLLAATYNLDVLEQLVDEPPVCVHCGSEAMHRCSRCKNEWYCSRPCQVKHWSKHKQICDMLNKTSNIKIE